MNLELIALRTLCPAHKSLWRDGWFRDINWSNSVNFISNLWREGWRETAKKSWGGLIDLWFSFMTRFKSSGGIKVPIRTARRERRVSWGVWQVRKLINLVCVEFIDVSASKSFERVKAVWLNCRKLNVFNPLPTSLLSLPLRDVCQILWGGKQQFEKLRVVLSPWALDWHKQAVD